VWSATAGPVPVAEAPIGGTFSLRDVSGPIGAGVALSGGKRLVVGGGAGCGEGVPRGTPPADGTVAAEAAFRAGIVGNTVP